MHCFGKQLRQMALVIRIEVLNQHECHAGIVRQMAEQLRECLQSAGGGAYANYDGERTGFGASVGWAGRPLPRTQGVGEPAALPGRRRPVCFATRHHYLSRRDDRASSLERQPIPSTRRDHSRNRILHRNAILASWQPAN